MTQTLELLTRKEYAERHNLTEQAIRYACMQGNLTRITFTWRDRDGRDRTGKFILPKQYAIIDREKLLDVARGIKMTEKDDIS